MRIRTEVEETRNGCSIVNKYNADTGEWISREVVNSRGNVACKTFSYYKAHKVLMRLANGKEVKI